LGRSDFRSLGDLPRRYADGRRCAGEDPDHGSLARHSLHRPRPDPAERRPLQGHRLRRARAGPGWRPLPDNTGGKLTIEGWAGTQADDILLDAALIDTTGRIKEIGKKLPGVIYTDATTFTGVSTLEIALANDPTGVRAWDLDLWDLSGTGVLSLLARFSYDGGGTYKSGASDYNYLKTKLDDAGAATTTAPGDVDTKIDVNYYMITAANRLATVRIRIVTPDSGAGRTTLEASTVACGTTTAHMGHFFTAGEAVGGYGRATHIRLLQSGQTITGKYRLTPLRGFGET
jgi:hypothetical protein